MKNLKRKLTAVVLTLVLVIASAMPAFAGEMSGFPTQRRSGYSTQYTRCLQVILLHYNSTTRSYITERGGANGSFGEGTENAVKAFQTARGISADGSCGSTTWKHLRATLTYEKTDGSYYYYRGRERYENYCMKQYTGSAGTWLCYYKGTWYSVG